MSPRESLHLLIEKIPDSELTMAQRFLEFLILNYEPYDVSLSAIEANESEQAWNDYLEGNDKGTSLDILLQRLEQ